MDTFKDLYNFLQESKEESIIPWLSEKWVGKDKQESLLRLFARLGIISKLKDYEPCVGNFNLMTIRKADSLTQMFYDEKNALIHLKDSGDSSDLTCIDKYDPKHILLTTSKNLSKETINKMDIDKILTNFAKYKAGYTMSLCICVRDKQRFTKMKEKIKHTNQDLLDIVDKKDTIIIDWNDLDQSYHAFKSIPVTFDHIMAISKSPIMFKLHQEVGIKKTLLIKHSGHRDVLWGHIQRSGKSYMMAGTIMGDNGSNYLIITTAPNETVSQYVSVFNCLQLSEFNVVVLSGNVEKPNLTNKNIIICSKQFLQTKIENKPDKVRSVRWLKDLKIDVRFLDESHNGGTTELAKKTLQYYAKDSFTVYLSATYAKPINDYDIDHTRWILWDLEDVRLCKKLSKKENIKRLIDKHGETMEETLKKYDINSIISDYKSYPTLHLLTHEITDDVIKVLKDEEYGMSLDACLLLKQHIIDRDGEKIIVKIPSFQNEEEVVKLWYSIFGKFELREGISVPDTKNYPDDKVFMVRIKDLLKHGTHSTFAKTLVVMAFLPQKSIDKITKATLELFKKFHIADNYVVIGINSKITNDPKKAVDDAITRANNEGKNVLVLSGKQCSLGVTIQNCDVVILMNNSQSFDMIYQMMFRCMTERKGKTCGFVIDMNPKRAINTTIMNYATIIQKNAHPREAVKYLLSERLINLNADHWTIKRNPKITNEKSALEQLCNRIYEIYSSDTEGALKHFLDRLQWKHILLSRDEQKVFNALFCVTKSSVEKITKDTDSYSDGIEKIKIEEEKEPAKKEEKEENEERKKEINYVRLLKHMIPLVCLLTIHSEETSFVKMVDIIKTNTEIKQILINQTKTWWGNVDDKLIEGFVDVYVNHMGDDKETDQIIRTVKELFQKNVNNSHELSILIDKYLIPEELEKKNNAEISTPHKLRKEMLDKIPEEFWKREQKVFEPCCGKGGFLLDIVDRFMNGLKEKLHDDKERYKTIVEKCLYWSDINETNIFVCKLLLDPFDDYKLNSNLGDTLELNVEKKWGLKKFDLVVGNPPYSTDPSKPNAKPIYNLFIEHLIDLCRMMLFVTPSRWFSCGKGLDKFRKMMINRDDIELIKHNRNEKAWFKNVVIQGGVSYFLKNDDYHGVCSFNGVGYKLDKYDCIIEPMYHKIIDSVTSDKRLTDVYLPSGYFKIRTNDKRLKKDGNIKCYVSSLKQKDRCMYLSSYEEKDANFWKVITSRANGHENSGFGFITVGEPMSVFTDSYIGFKVSDDKEASSLISFLKTNFVKKILLSCKLSQDISAHTIKFIPLVPLDRQWDDESVKKYLKL